jgi:type III pantothenate kinase
VDVKKPAKVVGTNTITHMQSGLYYGYIGLVDGILERILNETKGPETASGEAPPAPKIIATGGLARLIVDDSRFIKIIDDMLTLDGLRLIYERNRVAKVKHSHSEAAGKHA